MTEVQVIEAISGLERTLATVFKLVDETVARGNKISNIKDFTAVTDNFNGYIMMANRYNEVCFQLAYICKCEFQVKQLLRSLKDLNIPGGLLSKTKLQLENIGSSLVTAKQSLSYIKDAYEADLKIYNSYTYMSNSTQYNKMLTQ